MSNEFNYAQLVIYDQGREIKTVVINTQKVTIGRLNGGSQCDVYLDSPFVSSSHGFFANRNGEFYYVDLSKNGTYFNGRHIEKAPDKPSNAIKLRDGDMLSIGVSSISKEKTVYILFSTSSGTNYTWEGIPLIDNKNRLVIGRGNSCDIVVPSVNVSREHAAIERDSNGNVYISDLKSLNGTVVNGNPLKSGQKILFKERDSALIGSVRLYNLGTAILYQKPKQISGTPSGRNVTNEQRLPLQSEKSILITPDFNKNRVHNSPNVFSSRCYDNAGGVELRVENMSKIVPCKNGTGINGTDKKYILQNISLTIYPSELVAILGGSGAGKTTFMNAINGFEPATTGQVFFDGNDLYKNYQSLKAQIGYVPQQDIVYDNLTMHDMLSYAAQLRLPGDITKQEIEGRVGEVLNAMDLMKQKETLIKKMSGGQKKRASIAVELISDPTLFFLDEPTSGLDPEAETNLMKLLKNLSAHRGKTVIVITHTLQNIHLFDKVIFLAPGGKLCFYGSPTRALSFFEVKNLADSYEKISNNIDFYVQKFNKMRT